MTSSQETDVLVLGAGMAGLAAARALAERGLRVTVLEAREWVGGRVFSQATAEGVVVEQGAEFVHGRAPELWALMDECGVTAIERGGVMLREKADGGLAEDDREESMFTPLEKLETFEGEDVSFLEWLAASDVPEDDREALTGYVEGFNAADARRIGVRSLGAQQKAEDSTEGGRSWHIRGGYSQLAECLAARVKELGGDVRLRCVVSGVRWAAGAVEVETSAGMFCAAKCVVTLPLGVLQRVNAEGGLLMEPEPAVLIAARRMAMGEVVRFTLVFREKWWEQVADVSRDASETMSFLFTARRMPPVWWTRHPEVETMPTLTGWVGGTRSVALQGKSAGELGREACLALGEVFGVSEELVRASIVATYTHDWSADPFSFGAYSYVPAGAMDAPEAMTVPEEGTLFFAGEHTDVTGHWGTVHAAIRSGLRVAAQVLRED